MFFKMSIQKMSMQLCFMQEGLNYLKTNEHRHEKWYSHMSLVLISYFLLAEWSPGVQLSLSFCDISRVHYILLCDGHNFAVQ